MVAARTRGPGAVVWLPSLTLGEITPTRSVSEGNRHTTAAAGSLAAGGVLTIMSKPHPARQGARPPPAPRPVWSRPHGAASNPDGPKRLLTPGGVRPGRGIQHVDDGRRSEGD